MSSESLGSSLLFCCAGDAADAAPDGARLGGGGAVVENGRSLSAILRKSNQHKQSTRPNTAFSPHHGQELCSVGRYAVPSRWQLTDRKNLPSIAAVFLSTFSSS